MMLVSWIIARKGKRLICFKSKLVFMTFRLVVGMDTSTKTAQSCTKNAPNVHMLGLRWSFVSSRDFRQPARLILRDSPQRGRKTKWKQTWKRIMLEMHQWAPPNSMFNHPQPGFFGFVLQTIARSSSRKPAQHKIVVCWRALRPVQLHAHSLMESSLITAEI